MFTKELTICVNDYEIKFDMILSNKKDMISFINKKINIDDDDAFENGDEHNSGMCFNFIVNEDTNEIYNVIWLNELELAEDDILPTIIHESTHMAYLLISFYNLPLSVGDSEYLAYMVEGISTLVMDCFLDNNKR